MFCNYYINIFVVTHFSGQSLNDFHKILIKLICFQSIVHLFCSFISSRKEIEILSPTSTLFGAAHKWQIPHPSPSHCCLTVVTKSKVLGINFQWGMGGGWGCKEGSAWLPYVSRHYFLWEAECAFFSRGSQLTVLQLIIGPVRFVEVFSSLSISTFLFSIHAVHTQCGHGFCLPLIFVWWLHAGMSTARFLEAKPKII